MTTYECYKYLCFVPLLNFEEQIIKELVFYMKFYGFMSGLKPIEMSG